MLLSLVESVAFLLGATIFNFWVTVSMPTLLERDFPIDAINYYSSAEKGPGRPPYWEMAFWWTRKPLAGARAIIAASLLPDNAYQTIEQFLNDLFPCRNEKKTVHSCNPSPRLIEKLGGRSCSTRSLALARYRLRPRGLALTLWPLSCCRQPTCS